MADAAAVVVGSVAGVETSAVVAVVALQPQPDRPLRQQHKADRRLHRQAPVIRARAQVADHFNPVPAVAAIPQRMVAPSITVVRRSVAQEQAEPQERNTSVVCQ